MIIHKNLEQGTPEWYMLRLGKLTASDAQAIGNNGKGLETLCLEKVAEKLTGCIPEQIDNEDIARGRALEDEARASYELETGNIVQTVGFVQYDDNIGCSPDGLIGDDGLIEIKCKNNKNHLLMILGKEIDSKYHWQIQGQIFVTGRKWCDFVSYNPNFLDMPLKIIRVFPDEKKQAALCEGFAAGNKKIKEILEEIKNVKSNKKI